MSEWSRRSATLSSRSAAAAQRSLQAWAEWRTLCGSLGYPSDAGCDEATVAADLPFLALAYRVASPIDIRMRVGPYRKPRHMPESGNLPDSTAAFAELGELAVSARPLTEILQRSVELTRSVMGAAVEVSVTLIAGDQPTTAAATDDWAVKLDLVQYGHGYGPCLDSARAGQLVLVDDPAADERWPAFTTVAVQAGLASSLSVPLPAQRHVIGALNIYTGRPRVFTDERVRLAEQFASYAAVAIANTALALTSAKLAGQMQEAMSSRAVIEQAKGILMAVHQCDENEAFARLVTISQHSHKKLRAIARELVRQVSG